MKTIPNKRRLEKNLIPILFYGALAILLSWPLVVNLSTHLPAGTDSLVHYWNSWWVKQALLEGQSPYFTPYLFYPRGLGLVYHNFAWVHILLWLPLQVLVGGIAAYNVTFLLNLILCGLSAYYLANELLGDRRIALLVGLIYQAWPYRLTQPSHPNLISTWAIPLFLLLLTRAVKRKRWQYGVLAGFVLALIGYTRWQLLIPTALVGGVYLLFLLRSSFGRRTVAIILLAGAVALVTLLPPIILLANEWRQNPTELTVQGEEQIMQADLLAYFTPAGSHPLFGQQTETMYERYYADRGSRSAFSPYIGLSVLLLVGIGIWKGPRWQKMPWVIIGVLLWLLAMGPTLRVNGQQYTFFPSFYNFAAAFTPIRLLRHPDRFNMFLALPVSILAGYGMKYLFSSTRLARRSMLVEAVLGVVILFEFLVAPLTLQPGEVSPFYNQIATEPGEFAILNVPVDPFKSKPYIYAQTVHERPILQGHSSRYESGAFDYLEGNSWLLAMNQYDLLPPKHDDLSNQLGQLANDGIRYVVLHKDLIPSENLEKWRAYFALQPHYEDDAIYVIRTRPKAGEDFEFEQEPLPGIGVVRKSVSKRCITPGEIVTTQVTWGTSESMDSDYRVDLIMDSTDSMVPNSYHETVGELKSSIWGADYLGRSYYVWTIPVDVSPGTYNFSLSIANDEEAADNPVSLGVLIVQQDGCGIGLPPGVTIADSLFGNEIRLLGYRLDQDDESLIVTLFWQAERRLDEDYKVFVHVFDPATAIPVAQDDSMPRRWAYPTSLWSIDEVVDDAITISLENVPTGEYGVAIGVYDPEVGDRLKLVDAEGNSIEDGRFIINGMVVVK